MIDETVDISKYLDFGFYDKVWFRDNVGISTIETLIWLGISHQTWRLTYYHILTQRGKVIPRYRVHRVTNIEISTDEFK